MQTNIRKLVKKNTDYRHAIFTGDYSQLVVMNIAQNQEIGQEVHPQVDQIIVIIDGTAEATVDGLTTILEEDDLLCIPAGSFHNIRNIGNEPLLIYTIYSPPEHQPATVHHTKADADEHRVKDESRHVLPIEPFENM